MQRLDARCLSSYSQLSERSMYVVRIFCHSCMKIVSMMILLAVFRAFVVQLNVSSPYHTLSRSVGKINRKKKYGIHLVYPIKNRVKTSSNYRNIAAYKETGDGRSNDDVIIFTQ